MKSHDRVGSIFWLVIGTLTTIYAYQFGLGSLDHPGPGFIFLLGGLCLIILSTIDFARTFIRKPETDKDKEMQLIWKNLQWQKVLLVLGSLLVYIYFLDVAGFWISTVLLMIILFKGVEFTKWWPAILASLITALISYVIFKVCLQVDFPKGFLGF